jgi:hypothetical protein
MLTPGLMLTMKVRLLLAAAACSLASLLVASPASGAQFSRPVRLPGVGEGWSFVIAPDGQAVAVRSFEHGALVYQLGTSTTLGSPAQVTVAGDYALALSDGVLDDRHRLALAFTYFDKTVEPSNEAHGGPGCCDRVAIASWRLGEAPPQAQTLTPKLTFEAGISKAPSSPRIVLGPTSLTALWTLGAGEYEYGEGEQATQLREAFGPFGGPYTTQALMTAPDGIWNYALTSTPRGLPVASWVDDVNKIRTVTGLRNGALHHSHSSQALHGLIKQGSYGFTTNSEGQTLFAYQTPARPRGQRLLVVDSRNGSTFSTPRLIRTIPPEIPAGNVLLGPEGTVLASWGHWVESREVAAHIVRFSAGGLLTRFGPSLRVSAFPGEPIGFVGGDGETIVIYRDHRYNRGFLLDARIARRGHAFGAPHVLDPGLYNCGIDGDGETFLEPIETGPTGSAILLITCEDQRQYMVRFTPPGI